MKASLGRIILVKGLHFNGSDVHPAIINRVWGNDDTVDRPVCVNCTVFVDCGTPQVQSSVQLYDTEEAARASGNIICAWWPPKV